MKKIGAFLMIFLMVACTSNTIYKKPKNLIPKDTMALLIADLYIASSAYYVKNKKAEIKVSYMPLVYKKYGVDSLRFMNSNYYYTTLIDEYDELYKLVHLRLSDQKKKLEKITKTSDSLNQPFEQN